VYRVDFDAPAIVEEDFELGFSKDIPVIYMHQSIRRTEIYS
jgi:hypothetical protein